MVPDCGEAQLDDAASAARRAFPDWSAIPIENRRRALVAIGDAFLAPGYFVPMTILDNRPEDSRIVQEEQFGPILPLLRFNDIDEVIRPVNATESGLAGSVWGADEEQAFAVARRIARAAVWVNETQYLSPLAAFGGVKQSGLGVEGGMEGLIECTVAQTIVHRH